MRPRSATLILALLLVVSAAAARAQIQPEFFDGPPERLARDAFAAEYGQKLVAELGRVLRKSADAECLRTRNIDPGAMEERGREILVGNATRMLEIYMGLVDAAKLEGAFASRAGRDAKAEYARLRGDPNVKEFLALRAPARLAKIANVALANVERHALFMRIRLGVSPANTGNPGLLQADPTERSKEDVERFLKGNKSPQIKRWLELEAAFAEAWPQSVDRDAMLRLGPTQLTPGLDAELAALCMRVRRS